jgi:hypothetical protein
VLCHGPPSKKFSAKYGKLWQKMAKNGIFLIFKNFMKILHQLAFWGNQFTLELKSVCTVEAA